MALAGSSADAAPQELPAAVRRLLAEPAGQLAVLLDFDGTLAPIVDDPALARPDAVASDALARLAPKVGLAACVTGRPALQARELLGLSQLAYSGLHGAELLWPGAERPIVPEAFLADGVRVTQLIADAQAEPEGLAGLVVEHKGPIVALHWRRADDPAAAQARAGQLAERAEAQGLRSGGGRAVLELRPALQITKGDAVRALLEAAPSVRSVLFAGDDLTDLDAFDAISDLREVGTLRSAALLAIAGDDAPPPVAAAADLVLPNPAALGQLLATFDAALKAGR
ncbi:MAG: trehalose-phosphatase [Patulibacter sp.]